MTYEADDKIVYPFNELVGGAYKLKDCNCGSVICCGDISSRLLRGCPSEYDLFFVGEIVREKAVSDKTHGSDVTCIGLSMNRIQSLNEEYARKYGGDTSGKMLQAFLIEKFRRLKKPIGEETMKRRMLGLKHLSDGTLTMYEKHLLARN